MAEITIIPESIRLLKISDQEYFGNSEFRNYISNSKLSLINPDEGGSLEKYMQGYKSDYSDSFELGSAVHAKLLQPEFYEVSHIQKPGGKLGLFADKVYEYEKSGISRDEAIEKASISANYYSGKLTDKRLTSALEACIPYWEERAFWEDNNTFDKEQIYLSSSLYVKYQQCVSGLMNNKKLMKTLYPETLLEGNVEVYNEYAIFADVDVTIDGKTTRLKLKSKLDNFTINHETRELTLNDVKTTGKPVGFFMGNYVKLEDGSTVWYNGSFQKYHYYRQMGMYLWLLSCWHKYNYETYNLKANMVVVETIPEFKSRVYSVNDKQIKRGLNEFKNLLILVANG